MSKKSKKIMKAIEAKKIYVDSNIDKIQNILDKIKEHSESFLSMSVKGELSSEKSLLLRELGYEVSYDKKLDNTNISWAWSKKIKKAMKNKLIYSTLAIIGISVIFFLAGAFGNASFDIREWSTGSRVFIAAFWTIFVFFVVGIIIDLTNE